MDKLVISIITITYNCEASIIKTIDSVLKQDYPYIEYIIIDGDSNDGTKTIIEENKIRIRKGVWNFLYLSERDDGISDAFNKGISKSTGELILLLNAGDTFVSYDIISNVVLDWKNSNRPDFLYYRVRLGENTFIPALGKGHIAWEICQPPHQGSFISKKLYSSLGGYDTEYKLRMDYDFFVRCKEKEASHMFIPKVIVDYEAGGVSMQTSNAKSFYLEGIDIKRKYNIKVKFMDYVYAYIPNWLRNIAKQLIKR